MSKKEYLPILKDGFKEIGLWELDNYFLNYVILKRNTLTFFLHYLKIVYSSIN